MVRPAGPAALCVEAAVKLKQSPIAMHIPAAVAALIIFGRYVLQKMTNNAWFPSPPLDLVTFGKHLDDLEAAELKAKNKGVGTAAARDDAQLVVLGDIDGLVGYVMMIVSQNIGQASTIIESAGLKAKRYTKPQKQTLRAFLGPVPGVITLKAKAAGSRAAYEWRYSTDGGLTWVTMAITTSADTTLVGVTAGTTYLFQVRSTRKDVVSDWSGTVSLTAH
jgi:hypothetical protein